MKASRNGGFLIEMLFDEKVKKWYNVHMKKWRNIAMILFLGSVFPAFSFTVMSMFVGAVKFPVIQQSAAAESVMIHSIIAQPGATFIRETPSSNLFIRSLPTQWIGLEDCETTGTTVTLVASASTVIHMGKLPNQATYYVYRVGGDGDMA